MLNSTPPSWVRTTLGDLVALQRGHDLPAKARNPGNIPVIGSGGFTGWHDIAVVRGPGISIGRAANLGIPTLVHEDFWPLNTTLYVTDFHGNDVRFVYYLLKTLDLAGFNSGSVQPMLNRNYIRSVKLLIPDPSEQRRIGELLGALDAKIAANQRLATTASQLALALVDEERWRVKTPLRTLCGFQKVQVLPSTISASTVALYSLPAFDNGQMPERVDPKAILSAKLLVAEPAVLLSKLNPETPRVWHVEPQLGTLCLASTEFLVLEPCADIESSQLWAVAAQKSFISRLSSRATGTSNSHQRLRPDEILASEVVDIRAVSDITKSQVTSLVRRAQKSRDESVALTYLRDALLPKLISGELRIKDAS